MLPDNTICHLPGIIPRELSYTCRQMAFRCSKGAIKSVNTDSMHWCLHPEGEISLSDMDRHMMDCFSPSFQKVLAVHKKSRQTCVFLIFTRWIYIISEFTRVLLGIQMGVNIV